MRSLTVTLPDDIVRAVEVRVVAGDDASASEVVREGLESLLGDDPDLEDGLRDVVVPRRQGSAARPPAAAPIEGVLERIQRRSADET